MAEVVLIESARTHEPDPVSDSLPFNRRIEFHAARKPFNGISNGGSSSSNGFKLITLNPTTSGVNQAASGSANKSERPELFDSVMDPELGLEITFRRIGAGLRNLGNTCFLNSVLQCLTYTEPLAAYLQSGRHQSSCRTAGFCALCAIQKHVSRALQATGRILEPKDLVSNLRCISRNFRNARQEDAHEYMVNLLESMHKCCLPSGVPSESPGAYEKSLVHKIFGGRLRSQVKCMQCSFCSNKFDPFLDLSLEILKADSLQKALNHFTAKEHLDGGAKQYQCQHCKQKVKALKQLTVYKAPLVLAIHLKRFGHIHGQKIDKKISFGSTLDLKPFVSGSYEGDLKYTLYGVLVHAGWSTHSGHYFCFVRTSSGMWYSLDDNQVVQVSEKKVLEQKAYMLFYVRDRKSVCRKKPVNILQKENVILNAIGKSALSKVNQGSNEKVLNGSTEVNRDASAASTLRDIAVTTVQKESSLEKIALPNSNGKVSLDHLNPKPSPGIPVKQPVKCPSASNVNDDGPQTEMVSTLEVVSSATESGIDCNSSAILSQNPVSASVPPDNSSLKNSPPKKDTNPMPSVCSNITEEAPIIPVNQQPDGKALCAASGAMGTMDEKADDEVPGSKTVSMKTNMEVSDQPDMNISNQNSTADNLAGGIGHKSDTATMVETRKSKAIVKNKQSKLKVKRKLFKGKGWASTSAHSSSIIFGSLFGKKNHNKQRKKHPGRKVSSNPSSLCGNNLPSNIDQSLPGKSSPPGDNFTHLKKKAKQSSNDKYTSSMTKSLSFSGSNPSDIVSNDFKERSLPSGATTAADIQGPGDSKMPRLESRQKDVMNMLTRGIDDTIVARWDDIDSASGNTDIRSAPTTVQIGYVGDEWDEEYDKGKRKKVRNAKIAYDEPNPFQEIASRSSKRKRGGKLGWASSENPPFRIGESAENSALFV